MNPTDPTASQRIAVVLMAYGTPRSPADIESYYTDIRRGRPPTPEALADLTARYRAIGGVSPLAEVTAAQREAIQRALDAAEPGRYTVVLGMKHADPKVGAAAAEAVAAGADTIVGLVLAPHYSSASIGDYLTRMGDGVDAATRDIDRALTVTAITSWATEPAFVEFLAADLDRRLTAMRAEVAKVRVVFTAHSLPERVIASGDPYADELRATAEAVAGRLALSEGTDWQLGWQSAGRTPEPWIGPDILSVIDDLGADDAVGGIIVCACGFVADHLEVLYDLDIEAAARAADRGLAFDRTASVNDDVAVMSALAALVRDRIAR